MKNRLATTLQEAQSSSVNTGIDNSDFSLDTSSSVNSDFNLENRPADRLAHLLPKPDPSYVKLVKSIFGQEPNYESLDTQNGALFTVNKQLLRGYAKANRQKASVLQEYFDIDSATLTFKPEEVKERDKFSVSDPSDLDLSPVYHLPRGKEKLYAMPIDELNYAANIMGLNPDMFPKELIDATNREVQVKKYMKYINALSGGKQAEYIAMILNTDLFGIREGLSRKGLLPTEYIGNLKKGDTSAAIDAAGRVLAEKNNIDPINMARLASWGGGIVKTAIEFWMLPNILKGTKLATPIKYGMHSALQFPREDETLTQRIATVAESTAMGAVVGRVGASKIGKKAIYRVPTLTAIFVGVPLLEGKPLDQAIENGITVLGFEALNLTQSTYGMAKSRMKEALVRKAVERARVNDSMSQEPQLDKVTDSDVENMLNAMVSAQKQTFEFLAQPEPFKNKPTQIKEQILALIDEAQSTKDVNKLEEISKELETLDKEYDVLSSLDSKDIGELHKLAKDRGIEVPKGTTKTGLARLIRGDNLDVAVLNREANGEKTIEQNDDGTFTVWDRIQKNEAGVAWKAKKFNTIEEASDYMTKPKAVEPPKEAEKPPVSPPVSEKPIEATTEPTPTVQQPESTQATKAKTAKVKPLMPVENAGGKQRESEYFRRTNERLKGLLGSNPEFTQGNIADWTAKGIQYNKDYSERDVKRIALGYAEPVTKDVPPNAITAAYIEKKIMDGDNVSASKAANSLTLRATAEGQDIAVLKGVVNDFSPMSLTMKVIDARLKNMAGKGKKSEATTKINKKAKALKTKIEKKVMDIKQAQDILDSIIC